MKSLVRGTVCAVALMTLLTACGGDTEDAAKVGLDGVGKKDESAGAQKLLSVMPTNKSVSNGLVSFGGEDAVVLEGDQARRPCEEGTSTPCDGLVGVGRKLVVAKDATDRQIEFTLYSFGAQDAAEAASTALVNRTFARKDSSGDLPLEIGADETEVFNIRGGRADVILRVGNVVAYVSAARKEDLSNAAKVQVDLIKKAA
ncbi:hypothetical protein [Streptomyces sp. Isolate_45]|uniref:hypothetical protein n=1 Tax=Streptomyces sp. Isolate_45 TaxID=2950111 RepID=UPI002481D88F|nr:hypothetical protein [Streptomyces sp. Isolate_45]MDA5285434.1 hypothetical protein [Streptomyces sp. Isolate_45]